MPPRKKHYIKCWPEYFQPLIDEVKTFEIRKDDRNYQVGDILIIEEWDGKLQGYTGREVKRVVTYC